MIIRAVALALAMLPVVDHGQYADIPDSLRQWYKGVKAPNGVPCCDMADGHSTAWEMRADGHYWVPINGEWYQVPSEAVIRNAGNPTDSAIVWYVVNGPSSFRDVAVPYHIRCFVPANEV